MGQKKQNPWGLHDMHGNICEWCRDVYAEKPPGGRDPEVTEGESFRVFRGGSVRGLAGFCRPEYRDKIEPSERSVFLGFRMALSPSGNK